MLLMGEPNNEFGTSLLPNHLSSFMARKANDFMVTSFFGSSSLLSVALLPQKLATGTWCKVKRG
eukprot:CAMPEP_0183461746 /NCGR_PEP_ID=MMETSP0370-20130417/140271_1 /TAXON_ID=268820 /ORGANISM="Peridinium aciculiferum, Strain PAER-2" /LENGTH=63 /DNA_ID=CAMNT_0025653731 /DNA_START=389 /DNA_END=580 /DNA_ORIENTATION=+